VTRHFLTYGLLLLALLASGCGDDPEPTRTPEPNWDRYMPANQVPPLATPVEQPKAATPAQVVQGNVEVAIQPAAPTSADCLKATLKRRMAEPNFRWELNGETFNEATSDELCPADFPFRRDDQVTVRVGSEQAGGSATVTIGNSLPRITEVGANSQEVYEHADITVVPVAEDADGDQVDFRYEWFINGELESTLVGATLPADRYRRGDTIQVRITPFDDTGDGKSYSSAVMTAPNGPPQITSQPPANFKSFDYVYQVVASDPDDTKLEYSLEEAPKGMSIEKWTGKITWPLKGVEPGTYKVKITVTDPQGAFISQEYDLSLGVAQ